ncbi:MAG: hypothetical protein P8R03_00540, partial [Candidatus Poseidoniaceae archaeon]|nr:hypothetical protein [Candidatus Poseidoniaceae archaeon]
SMNHPFRESIPMNLIYRNQKISATLNDAQLATLSRLLQVSSEMYLSNLHAIGFQSNGGLGEN